MIGGEVGVQHATGSTPSWAPLNPHYLLIARSRCPQDSEDIRYMVQALETLGVPLDVEWGSGKAVVTGCAGRFPADGAHLFLGNAGTAMR